MASTLPEFPFKDAVVVLPSALKGYGRMSQPWVDSFSSLRTASAQTSQRLNTVTLPAGQAASIGATPIPVGQISAGLYRVTTYVRITQAATTSSSLTVTVGWTETAIPLTLSGAAIVANVTVAVQTNTYLIRVDANSPITYATTYASVGATPMQYRLDVVLERVDA